MYSLKHKNKLISAMRVLIHFSACL